VFDRSTYGFSLNPIISTWMIGHRQFSLAVLSWVCAMSTGDSWGVNRHTARCTSSLSVVWQCQRLSVWELRKQTSVLPNRCWKLVRNLGLRVTFAVQAILPFATHFFLAYSICLFVVCHICASCLFDVCSTYLECHLAAKLVGFNDTFFVLAGSLWLSKEVEI